MKVGVKEFKQAYKNVNIDKIEVSELVEILSVLILLF